MDWENQYKRLIQFYTKKYGEETQLMYLLWLQYLSTAFTKYMNNLIERKRLLKIYAKLLKIHNGIKMPESPQNEIKFTIKNNEILFDSSYYYQYVEEKAKKFESKINVLDIDSISLLKMNQWYLYIVSSTGEIITFFDFYDPVQGFKLRNGNRYPTHDMLAERCGLTVLGAGEFFITRGENGVGAIITNKSGHFQPKEKHLKFAINYFERNLKIKENAVLVIPFDFKKSG